MTKFILTSPTGHLGSRVLHSILHYNLIPASNLIICTSRPSASDILPAIAKENNAIETHTNVNFTQSPESIAPAFAGGDVLFLSSYPSPSVSRWLYHKNAIDAAILAGVTTVVYTSLMFGGETGLESVAGVQQAHIKTIAYLEEVKGKCEKEGKEFGFVVVRQGIYAESWWLYAGYQVGMLTKRWLEQKVKEGGGRWDWVVPNDGAVAWVGWDDLGEGTARIVARWSEFVGKTVRLTGPRATSISDVARIAAKETGVEVNLRCVGAEAACEWHKKRKSAGEEGGWVVESWSGWYKALEQGECTVIDPLLGELLDRQPKGIEELKGELFKLAE